MRSSHFAKVIILLIIILAALLRFSWLDRFPPALYTDEADQGYNAYSILKTGRDEHNTFMPVSLRSFGDWKPPLPSYLMVPFIKVFGLTEKAVRFPSALLGVASVFIAYLLVIELGEGRKYSRKLAFLTSYFIAISPWHIFQSRIAMLVMVGLFFLECGVYFFIKGVKNAWLLLISAISFALTLYSYYGLRVVTPLVLVVLGIYKLKDLIRTPKRYVLSVLFGLILIMPISAGFLKNSDVIFGRARTVSVFFDQGIKLQQWEYFTQESFATPTVIARFFHNSVYMYGRNILQRFVSHFDGRFLFINGDTTPPFQIPNMGILYLADIIFICIGVIGLYKKKFEGRNLVILWLLIAIIPAAFTFITPSSNRTFNAVVPFGILTSFGILMILDNKIKLLISSAVTCMYVMFFGYFLRQYFINLPAEHSNWWNFGWKETAEYVRLINSRYDDIVVFDMSGMPYIYFLFYDRVEPALFQKSAVRTYVADRYGFEHVESYDKLIFLHDQEWKYVKSNPQKKTLYIVPADQAVDDVNYVKAIYYKNNEIKLKLFSYE